MRELSGSKLLVPCRPDSIRLYEVRLAFLVFPSTVNLTGFFFLLIYELVFQCLLLFELLALAYHSYFKILTGSITLLVGCDRYSSLRLKSTAISTKDCISSGFVSIIATSSAQIGAEQFMLPILPPSPVSQ